MEVFQEALAHLEANKSNALNFDSHNGCFSTCDFDDILKETVKVNEFGIEGLQQFGVSMTAQDPMAKIEATKKAIASFLGYADSFDAIRRILLDNYPGLENPCEIPANATCDMAAVVGLLTKAQPVAQELFDSFFNRVPDLKDSSQCKQIVAETVALNSRAACDARILASIVSSCIPPMAEPVPETKGEPACSCKH